MTNRTVVEIRDARKTYGDITAVDNIDLNVYEGEFFSLLGPSGCGKTTTLRMISGLTQPTDGSIALFGEEMTDVPARTRPTNLVFQDLALFPHMSVKENIMFGLKHEDMTKAEKDDRVREMLDVVRLPGFEDRNVTELSGGQQQRVALARALAKQPAVLLLDEPLGSLDRKLRQQMQFELKQIQEDIGTTFFYVTHDQEIAITMSDRMAIMNEGEIIQTGPPAEIYEEPSNLFVADFIGDANFVEGRIARRNGQRLFVGDGGLEIPVYDDPRSDRVNLMIRPENVTLGDDAKSREVTFECEIVKRIYQGNTISYTVELASGHELDIRRKVRGLSEGDTTRIGLDRSDFSVIGLEPPGR